MKFIIKIAFIDETPIELFVDPETTTIAEFAQLYLDKLSRRYEYSIDNTVIPPFLIDIRSRGLSSH